MNARQLFENNLDVIDRAIAQVCRQVRLHGADAEDFALVYAMDVSLRDARDFHHRGQRHGEQAARNAEQQRLNAGQRQRHTQLDGGAAAFAGRNVNGAFQVVEDGADHVHAYAAAGNFGDFRSGAEARLENEIHRFCVG